MPNYARNSLVIRGDPKVLKYFYERNRVTQEEVDLLQTDDNIECDLSFEKCVSRVSEEIMAKYIQNNFIPKNMDKIEDKFAAEKILPSLLMGHIRTLYWGTRSEAIEPTAYLEDIENNTITYTFDTVWTPPNKWLISVSKIFKSLEFVNTYSLEEEGHDIQYEHLYKNGDESRIRKYNLSENDE